MAGKSILTRFFGILGGEGLASSSQTVDSQGDGVVISEPEGLEGVLESSPLDAQSLAEFDASRQQARMDRIQESRDIDETFGISTALLHISALDSTTRLSHAKRHGKVFTKEQALAFFEDPKNHEGCTCSLVVVLMESNGKPALTDEAQRKHEEEFSLWKKARRWGG